MEERLKVKVIPNRSKRHYMETNFVRINFWMNII